MGHPEGVGGEDEPRRNTDFTGSDALDEADPAFVKECLSARKIDPTERICVFSGPCLKRTRV